MRRKYELFATAKNFSHLRKIIRFCAGDPTSQCDAHTNYSQLRKILLICEKYFGKTANFGRICELFFAKRPRFSVFLALQIYFRVLKMRRFREKKFAMRRIFAGESPAQIGVFSKNISHLRRRFAGENPSHFRKIQCTIYIFKISN